MLPITIPIRPTELPEDFAAALRQLHEDGHPQLSYVLVAAVEAGWTGKQLSEAIGVTPQAISDRIHHPDRTPVKRSPRLDVETRARLLTMLATARTVNGAMPREHPARRVSEEFSAALAELLDQGYTAYALAKSLGLTYAAIRARLYRHGHSDRVSPSLARDRYRNRRVGDRED